MPNDTSTTEGQGGGESAAPEHDPTLAKPPGKPSGENVPPAGGEAMTPAESRHPHPHPGGPADT